MPARPHRITRPSTVLIAMLAMLVPGATIGVTEASAAPATARVMTFNVFKAGANAPSGNGVADAAAAIRDQGATVVAMQESNDSFPGAVAAELGDGWSEVHNGDVAILSSESIEQSENGPSDGARTVAALIGGVWYYSTHLSYDPYGPYEFCQNGKSADEVTAAMATQIGQAETLRDYAVASKPQVLMGDFNSPSGLDWTEAAKSQNCDTAYDWPTMKRLYDAGWADTYRQAHPDPVADPADSWSTTNKGTSDEPEPQDRIDFILSKDGTDDGSGVTTDDSSMVGGATNDWISDHYAFVSDLSFG